MRLTAHRKIWLHGIVALAAILAIACGASSPATPQATGAPAVTLVPQATSGYGVTGTTVPTATAAAKVTPTAGKITSARDSITLVINEEPIRLNPFPTQGGISAAPGKDNLVDPWTWQSGDDLRIVPTTATESWAQLAPDKWRFQLRKGVKFVNGEAWNARAALPSLAYQGVANNDNSSFGNTGGFKAEATGDYTVDINCDQACPIFANVAFFLNFTAPQFLATASEAELNRKTVSFGPYKLVKWDPGVSLTEEAYDDYVPAGDHFEFQKPYIRNVKWVWRGEPTVMTAMVQSGEADIAWDVGVDSLKVLPKERVKSGSSAEVFTFWINTLWHPELKKKKVREAMVHAINCQELVDSLYGGLPPCRGNIIWPGVIGATERNTAPYKYDPALSRQLLAEANYDPKNVIRMTGRAARIPKQVEVYEALQGYLKAVGMNVEVNVVEPAVRDKLRQCAIGKALNEVLEAQGKDAKTAKPTQADMQAALDKGGSSCPTADLLESPISSESLDFGRNSQFYLNCIRPQSFVCDPSPGGLQDQLAPAVAASGADRQRLLGALADRAHDDVLFLPLFDTPVIYAVNPKLNWTPRYDRRVRVNTMWFSK